MEHNPDQPFSSNELNSSESEQNSQRFEKTPFFKKPESEEAKPSNSYYKKTFSNEPNKERSSYNSERTGSSYNTNDRTSYNKDKSSYTNEKTSYNSERGSYNNEKSSYNSERGNYNNERGSVSGGYNKKPFNNQTGQGGFKKPFVKRPEFIKEVRGTGSTSYFKLVPVQTEQRGAGPATYTKKLNVPAGYHHNPEIDGDRAKFKKERIDTRTIPVYTDAPILSNEREESEGMRINKFIAHAGLCARRKADEYIKSGRVTINGEVMNQVGYRVKDEDSVEFDGKTVKPAKKYVYILLNKPRNVITTSDDEKGRKTVLDLISPLTQERVYPVGRLDRDTTGLVLLTNDGELAQRLAHPSHNVKKIYEVTLDKDFTQEDMDKVRNTIELADGPVPVDRIDFIKEAPASVVGIEIHLGRNRIVRRIFESLGYRVNRLDRVKYAMLTKKGIGRGHARFLIAEEITMLKYLL